MIEDITVGQIVAALTCIVSVLSGVAAVKKFATKWLVSGLQGDFAKINAKIDDIGKRVDTVDLEACKSYLVGYLSDVESGRERSEIETARFWEQYQHYEHIGGNSYVHRKVEQLKAEGKL